MTPGDVLTDLRSIEVHLRSCEVQDAYRERPEEERRRLAAARAELSLLIERLTTAELVAVAARLRELEPEVTTGIAGVKRRLARLDRPASVLDAVSRLLGVIARVAVLAG